MNAADRNPPRPSPPPEPALETLAMDDAAPGDPPGPAPPASPSPPAPAAPPLPPERFEHYEVLRHPDGTRWELGRGSMGVTLRAVDPTLRLPVALKVIDARVAAHPEARTRFLREAQAAAGLRHPNVASVFHFGETPAGQAFYVMELVEGETLETRVRRDGPLPAALALAITAQVAGALAAAEKCGLVHRDLKPANLMVVAGDAGDTGTPRVKVIDFGLAKAVAAAGGGEMDLTHGGFVGTPSFASPEQFDSAVNPGGTVDGRADIYALGVTLWYLLTGQVPHGGRNLAEIHARKTDRALPLSQLEATRVPASVVNLLTLMLAPDPAARPQSARELLGALARCRAALEAAPSRRRRALRVAGIVAVVLLALLAGWSLVSTRWWHRGNVLPGAAGVVPEKSIAVLPFENLSEDKENAFFADGVQDDILTGLAKVADLKVISRTSVLAYRSGGGAATRNLREIGRALGVAHVIEGSVRRAGAKVRVTAQLIDARTDAQLWADGYDRDRSDVFAIQSEIAQAIVSQLRAKLSPAERAALAERPTADLAAYDLYLRAKELVAGYGEAADGRETLLGAVRLLDEAAARDPNFALAFCLLARAHDTLFWRNLDATPARRALGDTAVAAALRLRPDLGEAHLAQAVHLYNGYRDFEGARRALTIAQRTLPNVAEVFLRAGAIDRRQGRWEDAVRNLERAVELDPRDLLTVGNLEVSYEMLRRYADAARVIERARAAGLQSEWFALNQADLSFLAHGETAPFRAALVAAPADYDPQGQTTLSRLTIALCDRDPATAARVLAASPRTQFVDQLSNVLPRVWFEGQIARLRGDDAAARTAFRAAHAATEEMRRARPEDPKVLSLLGRVAACLGDKDEAWIAATRAVELLPVSKDALDGPRLLADLAQVYAWTGETDRALATLAKVVEMPGDLSYGALRLDPAWDPLRGDPRFEQLLARLAPAPIPGAKP